MSQVTSFVGFPASLVFNVQVQNAQRPNNKFATRNRLENSYKSNDLNGKFSLGDFLSTGSSDRDMTHGHFLHWKRDGTS